MAWHGDTELHKNVLGCLDFFASKFGVMPLGVGFIVLWGLVDQTI
ncbi:hypothetical protein [Rubritalea tangerina]